MKSWKVGCFVCAFLSLEGSVARLADDAMLKGCVPKMWLREDGWFLCWSPCLAVPGQRGQVPENILG